MSVSGIFFSGPPYKILQAWHEKKIKIVLSQEIFEEYRRFIEYLSNKYTDISVDDVLDIIAVNAEFYHPIELDKNICDDPDDDKFIACAISSKAKIVISGDRHLLKLSGFQKIEIISPSKFIKKYL